jgi:hypothetical protein
MRLMSSKDKKKKDEPDTFAETKSREEEWKLAGKKAEEKAKE